MEIGLLSPGAWEGVSTVTLLIVLFLLHIVAVARGWIVWGPAHREIVKAKDESIAHMMDNEIKHTEIISTQATTLSEQRVAGELQAHVLSAIRDATAAVRASEEAAS